MNLDHEVESDHSLSHQQVLKGSTYPTTLRGCHIVFSMVLFVKHLFNPSSTQFGHDVLSRCCCPHGVMTPEVGQRAGLRTPTGSRTSRTGRGRRGEDGGARRGREARRVEDVADSRGEGGGAAGRGKVLGAMAALIVEDRGVVAVLITGVLFNSLEVSSLGCVAS